MSIIDLEKHVSVTAAGSIAALIRPLCDTFGIKFFRYLKLHKNGKRVVLSNVPDAIRYMYGQGEYVNLWYDGEFPEFLKTGWYSWHINRLLDDREIEKKIENDLTTILGVYHGITFVEEADHFFEVFSFDTTEHSIYQVDKKLLLRFVYYFREQARKLIEVGELDSLVLPINNMIKPDQNQQALISFLEATKINRYYLAGKYNNAYLTAKEAACVRWMIEGKKAEDIALLESIQVKTVQRHIENIKLKFNCQKQTQVIQLLLKTGFLEAF